MFNEKFKFERQPMTFSQKVIYDSIAKFIDENQCSPTMREIAKVAGLSSVSTVHAHLQTLKRKGYIDYDPDIPRSMELL